MQGKKVNPKGFKASNYNIFVHYEPDDVYIGYNAVSNGFYVFDAQQFSQVKNILANGGIAGNDSVYSLKDILEKGRFLVDDDMDELKLLKLRNNISRFNSDGTALVIAPTLFCPCNVCTNKEFSKLEAGILLYSMKKGLRLEPKNYPPTGHFAAPIH